jgi:excisionase family DNA binding protein
MVQNERLCVPLREAARLVGVSPRFLWGLVKEGKVPCVRLGDGKRRRLLFPLDTLRQWLNEQSQQNVGKPMENEDRAGV